MAIGRYLADTMAVVPRFTRAEFERMFNESVQDSVMVSYLANLMRAQVGAGCVQGVGCGGGLGCAHGGAAGCAQGWQGCMLARGRVLKVAAGYGGGVRAEPLCPSTGSQGMGHQRSHCACALRRLLWRRSWAPANCPSCRLLVG